MKLISLLILLCLFTPGMELRGESSLANLDRMLGYDYQRQRQQRIDSLKAIYSQSEDPATAHYLIAGEYADFNVDSALSHIDNAIGSAGDSGDEALYRKALLRKASIYNGSLMMYKEAADIFGSLSAAEGQDDYNLDYYTLGVQLYKKLAELVPPGSLRQEYDWRKRAYRDSVLAIAPDATLIEANKYLDNGAPGRALGILLPQVAGGNFSPKNGAMYHVIAQAYEQQGNVDKEIEYLTLAARADISNGVREYIALPRLAYLLYTKGDINRAYRYMRRSIDDARACNAKIRLLDMSDTMAIISAAHSARQQDSRRWLLLISVLLCLSLLLTVLLLLQSRRRNKLLHRSQAELREANRQLAEAGNIREKYGRRFMRLSLDFMDALDHYRLQLLKTASKRNFDQLYDAISSTSAIERESEVFYQNFDHAFLELYPNFAGDFNRLLRPEERVTIGESGKLNTELRIFALMKLGISESSEIAKLLHCSQSTVYNYRTRYRAKAIDKEVFDRELFSNTPV